MDNRQFQQRTKNLYQMLFEMATGNLSFRIPDDQKDDDLGKLARLLNTFAAQLNLAIKKSGYVVPFYTYQNLTQLILVLDDRFRIKGCNVETLRILAYPENKLIHKPFGDVLDERSQRLWNALSDDLSADQHFHDTCQFTFNTLDGKFFPAFCTITRLQQNQGIIITSVTTTIREMAELNQAAGTLQRPSDANVIQDLHDYILAHLEQPLPTLKELSAMFNTNEFKLKDSFRHFFKTSIYQFYNEKRLERAHLLIEQSNFTLKAIALMSGFSNYITFSKAFKKRFGYPPGNVKRL